MSRSLYSYNNIGQQRELSRKASMILDYDNNGTADIVYGVSESQGYDLFMLSDGAGTPTLITTISDYHNTEYGDYLFAKDMDGDGDLEYGILIGGNGYGALRIHETLTTQIKFDPHTYGSGEFRGAASHNYVYEEEYSGSSSSVFHAPNGTGGKQAYWSERILISDDFTLASSDNLYIKAGSIVRVAPGKTLTIYGDLEVLGTESSPVYFICDNASSSWNGFVLSKNASFNHCVFDDLEDEVALSVSAGSRVRLDHCSFKNFGVAIQMVPAAHAASDLDIDYCIFNEGGFGLAGTATWFNINIRNSSFENLAHYGIQLVGGTIDLWTTSFYKNARAAIYMSSGDLNIRAASNFSSNGGTLVFPVIEVHDTDLMVLHTVIEKNDNAGIYLGGVSFGDFSHYPRGAWNRIANNSRGPEIYFDKPADLSLREGHNDVFDESDPLLIEYLSVEGQFDITYNYWGDYGPSAQNFSPSALFTWNPYDNTPNTQSGPYDGIVRDRLETVRALRDSSQFEQAWSGCIAILDSFAVSELSSQAITELRLITIQDGESFTDLELTLTSYAGLDQQDHIRFTAHRYLALVQAEGGNFEGGFEVLNALLSTETDTSKLELIQHDIAKLSYIESLAGNGSSLAGLDNPHDVFSRSIARFHGYEIGSEQPAADGSLLPSEFSMHAFPNPFNAQTRVTISLPKSSTIQGRVYSILGREVASFQKSAATAGVHEFHLDASTWASGLYVVSVDAGEYHAVNKIVLVK